MTGQLTENQIEDVLRTQIIGHLACHTPERIYLTPISFCYNGEAIYAHANEGMKIRIMRENPRVCFQTDIRKNMADWQSVIVWGKFVEIKNSAERQKALLYLINRKLPAISSINTHLGTEWPFPPSDLNRIAGVVFKIVPEEKTGRFEVPEKCFLNKDAYVDLGH
jgi:uncharacterized protein